MSRRTTPTYGSTAGGSRLQAPVSARGAASCPRNCPGASRIPSARTSASGIAVPQRSTGSGRAIAAQSLRAQMPPPRASGTLRTSQLQSPRQQRLVAQAGAPPRVAPATSIGRLSTQVPPRRLSVQTAPVPISPVYQRGSYPGGYAAKPRTAPSTERIRQPVVTRVGTRPATSTERMSIPAPRASGAARTTSSIDKFLARMKQPVTNTSKIGIRTTVVPSTERMRTPLPAGTRIASSTPLERGRLAQQSTSRTIPRPITSTERMRPSTSRIGIRVVPSAASKTGLAKITTKSVAGGRTPAAPQKTTKEITHIAPAPSGVRPGRYVLPTSTPSAKSILEVEPAVDPTSVYVGTKSAYPPTQVPARGPLGEPLPRSRLSRDVESELMQVARKSPGKALTATGTKITIVPQRRTIIDNVPVEPVSQVISEKTVERSPGTEKVSRAMIGLENLSPGVARRMEMQLQQLEQSPPPHPTSPSKETVSVKSIISISPTGKRATDTVVTFETTKPSDGYPLTAEEVERLVVEENQDVRKSLRWKPIELLASTHTSFAVKRKEHEYTLTDESMRELQKSVVLPEPSPDEAPNDELQPELMATILHTEEKGMDMVSEPTTIYSYLFPDMPEIGPDIIEINSAAPAPLHDVAVPSQTLPEAFYNSSVNPELERVILETEEHSKKPSAAGFSDYQQKRKRSTDQKSGNQTVMANIRKKHLTKRSTNIQRAVDSEKPPWGGEEQQEQPQQTKPVEKSILDLVGASPTHGTNSEIPLDSFSVGLSNAEAVDYVLHVEPPVYRSKVQLRGTCVPPWFPGYYMAFPDLPETITLVKYPTVALTAAWKHTQPKVFPDESFVVI